jgi:hypothetical protein
MRSTGPEPQPGDARSRRGLHGNRRLAIIAGVSVLLLVSVAGAASAGAFTGRGHAPAGNAGYLRLRTAARTAAGSRAVRHRWHAGGLGPAGDRTSCAAVAHVGDSTTVGMVSPQSLPDPAERLAAQYRDVGVRRVLINASGGRSIVQQLPGQLNGYRVATDWYQSGYRGCWVFALGTNDAADVAVGSDVGMAARIQDLMSVAHGEPVMWVNAQTDLTSGPWSEANMRRWDATLVAACAAYPNMRIFNWAAMVQPGWHLADGIHYTSAGYAIRAHAIAQALARAFPANGGTSACVVQ